MLQSTGNAAASRKDWNARDSEGVSNDIVWVQGVEEGLSVLCLVVKDVVSVSVCRRRLY